MPSFVSRCRPDGCRTVVQRVRGRRRALGDPQGHGTDFEFKGPSQFPVDRGTYHYSFYGNQRYGAFHLGPGPITHMTVAEMQLIRAEGSLEMGDAASAAAIINATRVTRGRLPAAAAGDADLMDKLIYEKRIEEFILCSGCAFFDRRGFGPLAPTGPDFHQGPVEGTPLHFPIPGVALERLGLPNYTFGGIGMELAPSAAVALAVPARDVYQFDAAATGREKLAQLERARSSAVEIRRTRRR